jgi:hypothetical protein
MEHPLVAYAERLAHARATTVRVTRPVLERLAIPVRRGTKIPAVAGWPVYAHRRPTAIERARWAREFPCPPWNRAVILGPASGVVALDIESAEGHGQDGWRMLGPGRDTPTTLSVLTGSSGQHLYYLRPPEGLSSFPHFLPGVEVRSDGLPMLLPPSQVGDRPPYEWLTDAPIAPLPRWISETEAWTVWTAPASRGRVMPLFSRYRSDLRDHTVRILTVCRCGHPQCECQRADVGDLVHCPAHDDREPSLHLDVSNGRVLVYCFAGCTQTDVIAALADLGAWP